MQKTVPDHSPLIAANLICQTCGKPMKMEIIKSRRGVEELKYACFNPESGCSYEVRVNNMVTAQCVAVRPTAVPEN